MNRYALVLLSASFLLPAAFAADGHSGHQMHQMKPAAAKGGEAIWADGTVKKVDKAGGSVTISHGPLDNIGMAAMTMAFGVKDPAWLGKLKAGDRIRFVADYVDGAILVVRYEPVH